MEREQLDIGTGKARESKPLFFGGDKEIMFYAEITYTKTKQSKQK